MFLQTFGGRLSQGVALYARFRITPDPKDVPNPPNGQPVRDNRGSITLNFFDGDSGADVGDGSRSWGMSLNSDRLELTDGGHIHHYGSRRCAHVPTQEVPPVVSETLPDPSSNRRCDGFSQLGR